MEDLGSLHFSDRALAAFVTAEKKTVAKIVCHLFLNSTSKDETVQVIDNLQLHFSDATVLTIGTNEECTALDVTEFSFAAAENSIPPEFAGKIRLLAIDASETTMWKEVIGKTLISIRLSKDGQKYLADSLVLDFGGGEMREIRLAPLDGLIIDFFEE